MNLTVGKTIYLLMKYKKFITLFTVSLMIIGILMVYLLPKRYRAEASFYIINNSSDSSLNTMLSAFSPSLGRDLGASMQQSQISVFNLIGTRFVMESVAKKVNLKDKIKAKYNYQIYQWLRKHTVINPLKDGTTILSVYSDDSQYSADVVNAYIAVIDSFYRESDMFVSRNYRKYLEERIAGVYAELNKALNRLTAFEDSSGVVIPDKEYENIYSFVVAPLQTQLLQKKIEMDIAKNVAHNDVKYKSLKKEYDIINKQIESIYTSKNGILYNFPKKVQTYSLYYSEATALKNVYAALMQEIEQAKLSEKKNTPSLYVIDEAVPPERHYFPRKLHGIILGFFIGIILSSLWVLMKYAGEDN